MLNLLNRVFTFFGGIVLGGLVGLIFGGFLGYALKEQDNYRDFCGYARQFEIKDNDVSLALCGRPVAGDYTKP